MLRPATGPVTAPVWGSPWARPTMSIVDPLIAAGFSLITDPATGLAPAGYTCARDQPIWLPQADGSLASFAANAVPREWANGQWWYRTDPAWVNLCLWGDEQTAARGWVSGMSASVVGEDGLTPLHGGTYTKHTSPGSGSPHIYRVVAVTPGQSVNMSALVRMGTMPEESFRMAFYDATALAFISTQIVPTITRLAGGWSILDATITVPAGCTSMRAYPFRNGSAHTGGTFYVAAVNVTGTAYRMPMTRATDLPVSIGNHTWTQTLAALGLSLGSEYTLFSEYALGALVANYQPIVMSLSDNTFNESVYMNAATLTAGREPNWAVIDGGVGQANGMGLGPASVVGQRVRTLMRVKANDFRSAFNGALTAPDVAGTLPTVDRLYIGNNWSGAASNNFNGRLGRIGVRTLPGASDALLQALSQ